MNDLIRSNPEAVPLLIALAFLIGISFARSRE